MKLLEILVKAGVEKTLAEKISNENKFYSQDQVDDIVEKARATTKKNVEGEFNHKLDIIQNDYKKLQSQVREKEIKDFYIKNGGLEEFFNDFMKVNGETLTDKESIQNSMFKSAWCLKDKEIKGDGNFHSKRTIPKSEREFEELFEKTQSGSMNFFEEEK